MQKIFVSLLVILCVVSQVTAERFKPVDHQIMDLIFNGQREQADSLIDLQISQSPKSAKYYFMKAPLFFYSRYFNRGNMTNDSLMQMVVDNAQKSIELGEAIANKSIEDKFYLGCAYGFLSRIQIIRHEYWDGYWSAWDSEDYLEAVLEEDPAFIDAYLGLGVLEYYPDRVLHGFYAAVAWVTGMSGDAQKGLEYWHTVAEKGELLKTEAQFILATMYRFLENDPPQSLVYLEKLQAKFPNNAFVRNQYQQTALFRKIEEKGVTFLETEFDSLKTKHHINNALILNAMGYYLMGRERFEDALVVFKTNVQLYPGVANCYDSLAECYLNSGDRENARKYYELAYAKLPADSTINDEFRSILKDGIQERLDDL